MAAVTRVEGQQYWSVAWPAAIEGLLLVLLSSVDLMMVGSLGPQAVAAVGIFSQPKMIMLCFSRALAVAVTVVIARWYGQNQFKELSAFMKQSTTIALLGAAILLIASYVYMPQMLRLAGAQWDYLAQGVSYGKWATIGLFVLAPAIVLNGGLTGLGRTKTMLVSNIAGNGVNVICNGYFIYILGWGVAGAGIATMIGNMVTLAVVLVAIHGGDRLLSLGGNTSWVPSKKNITALYAISSGVFLEQGCERIGMFAYSYLTAQLGMIAFATHNICMTLCDVFYSFGQGLSKGATFVAGHASGQRSLEKITRIRNSAMKHGWWLSVGAMLIYLLLRQSLMELFTQEPQVIALGSQILWIVAIVSIPQTQSLICSGLLRGLGHTRYVAIYCFWSIAIIRPIVTWLLCFILGLGLYGAWIALLIDQTTRMVCAWKKTTSIGVAKM